nr:putative transcription elongation factor SPT5 homolog 1 [Ipomoea batatas]
MDWRPHHADNDGGDCGGGEVAAAAVADGGEAAVGCSGGDEAVVAGTKAMQLLYKSRAKSYLSWSPFEFVMVLKVFMNVKVRLEELCHWILGNMDTLRFGDLVHSTRKSDKIKIMGGAQRGTTGKLIGVDGTDGIVKIDDTLDVKILDMVILAKLTL